MNLSERISTWRHAKGMSQHELATACEVTVAAVSYWESGTTTPSQKNLLRIVDAFGLTMERFYGRVPRVA